MALDALAQRLALRQRGTATGEVEQRQVHALRDQLADAARRVGGQRRQLAVGVAHRLERQPRDAALAQRTRAQLGQRQPALEQRRARHHHDQVLDARRVVDGVACGGVVQAPLAGADPGLAAMLLDAGAADEGRDDLDVAGVAAPHQCRRAQHPVPVGLEPGQDHVAGLRAEHAPVEHAVTVEVRLQATEQAVHPVGPEGHALARRDLIGAHQRSGRCHRSVPVG